MAYFRDKDLKAWKYEYGLARQEQFDEIVDFIDHDCEDIYGLSRDGSFCGIRKVVKIGKTYRGMVCLDIYGRIRTCLWVNDKFKILIKAKDFWTFTHFILVKCMDNTYRMYCHDAENVRRCKGEFTPSGEIIAFTFINRVVNYYYRKSDEQIVIIEESLDLSIEDGNLKGLPNTFPLPIKYLRRSGEYIMVFLVDGSLHILQYDTFDIDNYILEKIVDSPCYPLDYICGSSTKSSRK